MRLFRRIPKKDYSSSLLGPYDDGEDDPSINNSSLFTDPDRSFLSRQHQRQDDEISTGTRQSTISKEFAETLERYYPPSPAKSFERCRASNAKSVTQRLVCGTAKTKPHLPMRKNLSDSTTISDERYIPPTDSTGLLQNNSEHTVKLHEGCRPSISIEERMQQMELRSEQQLEPIMRQGNHVQSVMAPTALVYDITGNDSFLMHRAVDSDDDMPLNPNDEVSIGGAFDSDDEMPLNPNDEVSRGGVSFSDDEMTLNPNEMPLNPNEKVSIGRGSNVDDVVPKPDDVHLMRSSSPGAMRLTQAGLDLLDKKSCQELLKRSPSSLGYERWKEQKQCQAYMRQRIEEREERLQQRLKDGLLENVTPFFLQDCDYQIETKTLRSGKTQRIIRRPPPLKMTTLQKLGIVSCSDKKRRKSKKADICEMSLAPMVTLKEEDLDWPANKSMPTSKEMLLKLERKRQMEAQQEKEEAEMQESVRIAQMRTKYIEQQRALEATRYTITSKGKDMNHVMSGPHYPVTVWTTSKDNIECAHGVLTSRAFGSSESSVTSQAPDIKGSEESTVTTAMSSSVSYSGGCALHPVTRCEKP